MKKVSFNPVRQECTEWISKQPENGNWDAELMTRQLCELHSSEYNGEFALHCVRRTVMDMFGRLIRSMTEDTSVPTETNQLVFKGMHLQKRYLIGSNGILLSEMTGEQILTKAKEIGDMGRGAIKHENALLKYYKEQFNAGTRKAI